MRIPPNQSGPPAIPKGNNELKQAIAAYQVDAVIAILTAPALDDKTPVWASLNSIGERFFAHEHFAEALTLHLKAYEVVQCIKNNAPHLVTTLQNIARCYFGLGDFPKACEFFGLEMEHEFDDLKRGKILLDIGSCYLKQCCYTEALQTYLEAHSLVMPFVQYHTLETAISLNGMGFCHLCLGNYRKAMDFFNESRSLMTVFSPENHQCMIDSLEGMSECHKNLKNVDEANKYWDLAYLLAKHMYGEADPITQKYEKPII